MNEKCISRLPRVACSLSTFAFSLSLLISAQSLIVSASLTSTGSDNRSLQNTEGQSVVDVLIKDGGKSDAVDKGSETLLYLAVLKNDETMVEDLLKAGAKIDVVDTYERTPLHVAAEDGYTKIIEMLLKAGAHINIVNKDHETPLHLAAWQCNKKSIEILLNAGAKADLQDKSNKTALHIAAWKGDEEIVEVLLKARVGTNINRVDMYGKTPLHVATRRGYGAIVEMLLKAGARYNVLDKYTKTPLYLALQPDTPHHNRQSMIHLLLLMERDYIGSFSLETHRLLQHYRFDTAPFEKILAKSKELIKELAYYQELIKLLAGCGMPIVLTQLMREYVHSPDVHISVFKQAESLLAIKSCPITSST